MDQQFITTLAELLSHFFLWSSALALIIVGLTRISKNSRYWPTLWKSTMLLCLLPLFPWSYFDWLSFEWAFTSQKLLEYPKEWMNGFGLINAEESNHLTGKATVSNNAQMFLILALLVVTVSLARLIGYFIQLKRFYRALQTFNRVTLDSPLLVFLSEKQRAFIQTRAVEVLVSDEPTSPYVTGVFRAKLVLPKSFFSIPSKQQVLLFEHELTHIKNHDVAWLIMSQVLTKLFWFTPAIQFIRHQLELSIEIQCDAQVLDKYPSLKKDYGMALLNVIKLTQRSAQPQTAFFIGQQFTGLKDRIQLTQQKNKTQGINFMHKITLGISALLLSSVSWALSAKIESMMNVEKFLSIHKHATKHIDQDTTTIKPTGTWINPVPAARVSSTFKAKQKIRGFKAHLGIDLAAKKGEPIVASNSGTVVIADDETLHKNYGKIVVIDHGEGTLSMYLHMDSIAVSKGDTVTLGQSLGKVGETGKTSGPHLHFEVITAGRHIDPASIIEFN